MGINELMFVLIYICTYVCPHKALKPIVMHITIGTSNSDEGTVR